MSVSINGVLKGKVSLPNYLDYSSSQLWVGGTPWGGENLIGSISKVQLISSDDAPSSVPAPTPVPTVTIYATPTPNTSASTK